MEETEYVEMPQMPEVNAWSEKGGTDCVPLWISLRYGQMNAEKTPENRRIPRVFLHETFFWHNDNKIFKYLAVLTKYGGKNFHKKA